MPVSPPSLVNQVALHEALVRNTGYLLSRLGTVAQRAFAERMSEIDLTPRAWGALNVLDQEGEITQQSLGRCIGMDPSTMVSTIDELEQRGLVQRRRNPQDRRAHALHITAKGRRILATGREVAAGAQEELLAPLDPQERKQLHKLLLRLAQGDGASDASSSARTAAG